MRDYSFNLKIAILYGVDEAIFIHSLEYWISKNRANGRHFHDGRWWSYNSVKALEALFPFWSKRQLERIINSCKNKCLVHVGDYNTDRRMRTCWYALDDVILDIYGEYDCISPNSEMHSTKPGDAFPQTVKSLNEQVSTTSNIPPIAPREVLEVLGPLIDEGGRLSESLTAFLEMRKKAGKPLKTNRAATLLLNRLRDLSGGSTAVMADMLDESTLHGWTSVYPPKAGKTVASGSRVEEIGGISEWQ